jgi:hypothetical protein
LNPAGLFPELLLTCLRLMTKSDCPVVRQDLSGHVMKGNIVKTIRRLLAPVIGIIVLAGGMALAQASDPLVGTWKLNAAKSKGSAFTSGTTKIEKDGDGIKLTVDLMPPAGPANKWSFSAKYDGKYYPVTGNSPYGDSVAVERVDAHTFRFTSKMGEKVTATQTIVVSADGKTRTNTTKGTDAKGQPVDSVAFYEKQ